MATVYLAQDLKHHRQVAIKVLRPDLAAAIGPERFLREIEIAAGLTHPNILPLYDSGEADGLLYYVMPYVEGESLRDRLTREKQLPVEDALQITREVADALGYAHSLGIVHRDIKPENVLFEVGHAVVADFGIARAIDAAGTERLTETGLAVGTPAYMSPEQATGTKEIDARTDIYSLGCVLYEMLAGEPPCTGPTVQAVLAKKLSEATPRVSVVRDMVPEAVEDAVVKALAKAPADRFVTAEQFIAALAVPSGAFVRQPRAKRRRWLKYALAVLLAVVVVAGYGLRQYVQVGGPGTLLGQEVLAVHDHILVVEFLNRTDDSLLGAVVTEAVETALRQSRVVQVLSAEAKWEGMRRMDLEPSDALPDSLARQLAVRENTKAYVSGDVSRLGSSYQLTARVHRTADGDVLLTETATAQDDEHLIKAVGELGDKLRRGIGESLRMVGAAPPLERVTTPSLPALRAYMGGVRAHREGQLGRAIMLLQEAVSRDTAFAMAWRKLGIVLRSEGLFREATEATERAYALRNHLREAERLHVTAEYHAARGELALAEVTYRQLVELEPDDDRALNNLAVVLTWARRWAEAESLALRAIELGPRRSAMRYVTAVEAQVPQRRFEAADSVLLRMARHFSGNAWLRQLRVLLPAAGRDYDAAEAVLDSLEDSGVPDDGLPIRDYRCGLALVRGHLSEFRRQCGFYAPVVRAFWELRYTGDTARVGRMVDSVADRSRDSLAPEDGSYALLATTLAELGRAREARQCLALWQQLRGADEDEGLRRDAGRVAGSIALAEGKLDSAVTAFLAWNTTGDPYVFNLGLPEAANAHDLAGRSDSAIALYERALATPSILGFNVERSWYPHALRRLGELHESLGHREQAIVYYSQFIELWKNADPELEPRVQDARETLARLVGEPQP